MTVTQGKGAVDLFKKDFITERRVLGLTANPASKEFWVDFRAAWASLDAARRQNYEGQADSSKMAAKLQRRRSRDNPPELADEQAGPADAASARGNGAGAIPALAAGSVLVAASQPPPGGATISPTSEHMQPEYPMSTKVLDAVVSGNAVMEQVCDFRKHHETVQPNVSEDVLGAVRYPRQCRGLCEHDTPKCVLRMHKELLVRLAKSCPPSAVAENLTLAIEVERSGELTLVCFALLCLAAGKYGRFPPTQTFLKMEILTCGVGDEHVGAVLRGARRDHVAVDADSIPKQFQYYAEVAKDAGAYATADESELAVSVLHHVLPDWPDSVVVKFLEVAPDFRAFGAQGDVTQLKVLGQKDRPLFYQAC